MENIYLEPSDCYPLIIMNVDGKVKFEGRALIENAHKFFEPLLSWAKNFNSDNIDIEINLEYFNTSVSKHLLDLLKEFENNPENKNIHLSWHYEEGDDEMLETGEIFEELLPGIKFNYHQYDEIFE